jgi:small-conductance mechanosensitive channel
MFRVFIPISDYTFQWEVLHEARKEVLKGFRKRKIEIPFPIRTVYTQKR